MNRVEPLREEARALIEATRDAFEPSASNRAQVRWAVERRVSAPLPPRVSVQGRRTVLGLAASALVLGGVGVAAALAWRSWNPATEPAQLAIPRESAQRAPLAQRQAPTKSPDQDSSEPAASVTPRMEPAPPVRPTQHQNQAMPSHPDSSEAPANVTLPTAPAASAPRQPAPPARPSGDLAAEAALIARAQTATNRGQGARALELLYEYDRRFGTGALAEERAAASVFALCSAGRVDQARAEAERFRKRWPRSPQAARVGRACASGSPR